MKGKQMDMTTPKGRNTIRKNGSVTGATGQTSRMIKRWNYNNPKSALVARLEAAYWAGIESVDLVEERSQSNKTSGKLTREGARDNVLNYALQELIPNLHKARLTIKRAKAEVAERKSKLKVEGPDPSDIAAAFRRMEIRTRLREMKDGEQREYFAKYGDNLPSEIAAAVLELPPEYSGVMKPEHERIAQHALAARHGAEIGEIAEIEEAISAAESTIEIGRDELRLEVGGIDKQKWDELAAPIEAKHSAAWLRRRGTEVHVVDLERRVERKPTDEELATGLFANTHDEYLKEQTTALAAVA
jgi:hypothetical protein